MKKIDLHLHTTGFSPASTLTVEELAVMAPMTGLDGVVFTELNRRRTADERQEVKETLQGMAAYHGMEVVCKEGHFLVYGTDWEGAFPSGLSFADMADKVGSQAAIVWAHPGRPDEGEDFQPFPWERLDAIEVMGLGVQRKQALYIGSLLERSGKPPVSGSDTKIPLTLGTYATQFEELPQDDHHLAALIKAGRVVPWVNRKAVSSLNIKFKDPQECFITKY